jgi:hypothetical protein
MWWLADKMRLARELRGLTDLAKEGWLTLGAWSLEGLDLQAVVTIRAAEVDYALRLVFPSFFPNVPAWTAPTDDQLRLSGHQFGAGGSLCLELGPDNWTPLMTGADILRSAHKLLSTENPQGQGDHGEVEEGHQSAPFQVGLEQYSILVDEAVFDRLKSGALFDPKALRWWPPGTGWPVFLHDHRSRTEGTVPPTHTWLDGFLDLPVFQTTQAAPEGDVTRAGLINAGDFADDTRLALGEAKRALLVFGVGADPKAFAIEQDKAHGLPWHLLQTEQGVRSGAPPERCRGRVAIVGAGSVGSKLAETLVRSGVRDLTLIDGDIFLPVNLERNALDWRDVGGRKVDAVKARLLLIAPQVNVTVETKDLAWQNSSRNHAGTVAAIGRCDVIIDATGDTGSALMLGALAASANKPFVSVEVLEGGVGALVAACLPSRDPSYGQARANFLEWCAQQGHTFAAPTVGRYGGFDAGGAPIVADDAAVTVAVGHAGRTILDILDGQVTSRARAWQLIGLSEAWVFGKLGPYVGIDVGEPDPSPPPVDPQTEAFVQQRLKEIFDAPALAG